MNRLGFAAVAAAIVLSLCQVAAGQSLPGVYTYHYDNARDGQNPNETILTPSNVNPSTFGKLFSRVVDGYVFAEPLYVNGVQIPNLGMLQVVYVATAHDSVYAFDASGALAKPLWKVSFLNAKNHVTSVPWRKVGTTDIVPEIGITGTPVIDPASNTLYVAAETLEKTTIVYRLHALDLTTGAEKFNGPIVIAATVPGTAPDSVDGNINFVAQLANQRSGLALNNGVVYLAFASHGDNGAYHGWVLGYDASTLTQLSAFATTPDGSEGGIWMAGGAPIIDSDGNLFVSVGNGSFDTLGGVDYGDSVLKLGPTGDSDLGVIDYFTPFNQELFAMDDLDMGSGGVMALPDQTTGPQHLLLTGDKQGTLFLIDRDSMGFYNPNNNSQIVQSVTQQLVDGVYSTPVYFNGMIYVGGDFDDLKAFSFTNGQLSAAPLSASASDFQFSGTTPVVSANGTQNGIVWAIGNNKTAVLRAFDATDLTNEVYNSSTKKARDAMTGYVKFTVPTVANGRVFVGSQKRLTAFGLLPPKK